MIQLFSDRGYKSLVHEMTIIENSKTPLNSQIVDRALPAGTYFIRGFSKRIMKNGEEMQGPVSRVVNEFFSLNRKGSKPFHLNGMPDFNGNGLSELLWSDFYEVVNNRLKQQTQFKYQSNFDEKRVNVLDVNGDGFADLAKIYSQSKFTYVDGKRVGSKVTLGLYFGNSSGLNENLMQKLDLPLLGFIVNLTPIKDFNGDGFADLLVSQIVNVDGNYQPDLVLTFVFGGCGLASELPTGLKGCRNSSVESLLYSGFTKNFVHVNVGRATNAQVKAIGDFNGDGLMDFLIEKINDYSGFPRTNEVSLYKGSENGIDSTPIYSFINTPQPYSVSDPDKRRNFNLRKVGDYNEDGLADLLVTYWTWTDDSSKITQHENILLGSNAGLSFSNVLKIEYPAAYCSKSDTWQNNKMPLCNFGPVADLNGDGLLDFQGLNLDKNHMTSIYLSYKNNSDQIGVPQLPGNVIFEPMNEISIYSAPVPIGDFDGDGYLDAAVRSWGFQTPEYNKPDVPHSVYLYRGSENGMSEKPSWSLRELGFHHLMDIY